MAELQLSQEFKTFLKWSAIGALFLGVGYFTARIIKSYRKGKPYKIQQESAHRKSTQIQRIHTHRTEYSQFYFDKDLEISFIESGFPESPSVEDIYINSPNIARDQFIKYTRQMRRRRRLIRKSNEDQYINSILTYQSQIQQLLLRSRMELLEYLHIDAQNFISMEQNYEVTEDLRVLHHKSQNILRRKLISHTKQKKISDETLVKIMEDEIAFIDNKMYDRLRNKLQNEINLSQSEMLVVIEILLEDLIYEKYGYESEDVQRKIEEDGNCESQIVQARGRYRKRMEADIGDFNYESYENLSESEPEDNSYLKKTSPTVYQNVNPNSSQQMIQ